MTRALPLAAALSVLVLAVIASPAVHAAYAETVVETVHLVVTGGAHAGTFDASGTHGGCSYGLAGPGSWGNQISSPKDKDPNTFNSLQLIVPDAKAAAGGAKEFFLMVGFGPLLHRSAEYKVETRPSEAKKSGSGTVTVDDRGTTGKVTFSVTTADGVTLDGTIDCKTVSRSAS
ncbi:MAG: hypothetical protein ABI609_18235 [Acidobacteriota bacterium]